MAQLVIREITRINLDVKNLEIRQGFGNNKRFTIAGNHIFSAADPNHPAAFLYDPNHIPLSVEGSYVFGAVGASYRLRGSGPNGFVITSQSFNVPANPSGRDAFIFTATVFSHQDGVPGSPFKLRGDFTWSILRETNAEVIATSGPTHLELYFMFGEHALPYSWPGIYLLDLIDLSFPDYAAVRNQPWANLEGTIIRNAVRRLWGLGGRQLFYDSTYRTGGASQYLLGTEFN